MSVSAWLQKVARDPISGLSHLAGALTGFGGLIYLLLQTIPTGEPRRIAAALVFGISLVLLYLASAAYHLLHVSEGAQVVLRRIDHALIFTLIAGTYTPFCLVTMANSWGTELLMTIWSIAIFGLGLSLFWIGAPRWLTTALYLFMGWFIVLALPAMKALPPVAMFWLIVGGGCYTLGAVIYALKWPNPYPPHFGFHEIWHLFVLGGSTSHFLSVATVLS